jgi:glycosyltransferase involved in cell wall biosynthesis
LKSVIETGYPNLEIIVVDDCSTDSTAEVASEYPVQVIKRQLRGGIAAARNDGVKAARGKIVAFVDSDCAVDKPWLSLLLSHYADSKIAGVGGVIGTRDSSLIAKYRSYLGREEYADSPNPVYGTLCIPGGNSSYRTDVFHSIGGFDPAFAKPRGYEELELGYRLTEGGYVLVGEPRAVVWHLREGSLKGWIYLAYATGYVASRFLRHYRGREFFGIQVRQIAFLVLLLLCVTALIGVIPVQLLIDIGVGILVLETLRTISRSIRVVAHYRNPIYLVMVPVELMLTVISCLGYALALLAMIWGGAGELRRRLLGGLISEKWRRPDQHALSHGLI